MSNGYFRAFLWVALVLLCTVSPFAIYAAVHTDDESTLDGVACDGIGVTG